MDTSHHCPNSLLHRSTLVLFFLETISQFMPQYSYYYATRFTFILFIFSSCYKIHGGNLWSMDVRILLHLLLPLLLHRHRTDHLLLQRTSTKSPQISNTLSIIVYHIYHILYILLHRHRTDHLLLQRTSTKSPQISNILSNNLSALLFNFSSSPFCFRFASSSSL